MARIRDGKVMAVVSALGIGLGACDGGGADPATPDATTGPAQTSSPDGTGEVPSADGDASDPGCVAGQEGCVCLDDQCQGGLFCQEGACVLGPQIDVGDDRAVIGGIVISHSANVDADTFAWSQDSGSPVEILGAENLDIALAVPADAPPGEVIRLRLEATRNGVTAEAFWQVLVLEAAFENALPQIADPAELGTTEGLEFGPEGMYVVSLEGFVSRFSGDGEFLERYDVGGRPIGANFVGEDLVIANAEDMMGRVQRLNSISGSVSVLFDALADGAAVGAVNYPLPDDNGNLFVSTRLDQSVLYYDAELGTASTFLSDPALVNPNALAFGPEGNTLYVGTVGRVWRVPIVDGGGAGAPELYLDLGEEPSLEVDGLVFDADANLWVGCPGAGILFVAPYAVAGPTEVSRSFVSPAAGLSGFVNLRFGANGFDGESLYYTNLGDGTVGRLRVGQGRL